MTGLEQLLVFSIQMIAYAIVVGFFVGMQDLEDDDDDDQGGGMMQLQYAYVTNN